VVAEILSPGNCIHRCFTDLVCDVAGFFYNRRTEKSVTVFILPHNSS